MKVQQISEPEWAEGKEVTLKPDTVNITDLTVDEFNLIREAIHMHAKCMASGQPFVDAARLMLQFEDAEVVVAE